MESLEKLGAVQSSTTRGVLGPWATLGLPRRGGMALTNRSAATRRVRVPTLPFSNAPLGPKGDFDRLFAVGARRVAVGIVHSPVDDAEPDFGLGDASLTVRRPAHSGRRTPQRLERPQVSAKR